MECDNLAWFAPFCWLFCQSCLDGESVILFGIICLFICVRVSGLRGGCVLVYRTPGGEDCNFTGSLGLYAGVVYFHRGHWYL